MPSSLDAPVLQVDANVIHKVDTSNPQNLFSMWTVFARCADNVAQGRRLENLSWRLWTRETFCVEAAARMASSGSADSLAVASDSSSIASTSPRPTSIPRRSNPSTEEVPQLSGSVESIADEDAVDFASESSAVDIARPRIRRQDSCGSSRSRGRERHITSDDLEKMVVSIVQETEPLKAPLRNLSSSLVLSTPCLASPSIPEQPTPSNETEAHAAADEATSEPFPAVEEEDEEEKKEQKEEKVEKLEKAAEEAAAPSTPLQKSKSTTEVIRGFSPSHVPIVLPQILTPPPSDEHAGAGVDEDAIPDPTSAPAAKQVQSKKATFALGGSSSCEDSMSDPSRSLEMPKSAMSHMMKRKSTPTPEEEGSLKSALHLSRHSLAQKKQTSFSNQLVTRTIPAPAAASDDDDDDEDAIEDESDSDDIDESAIDDDDDDSSEWEDSNEESGRSSMDDKNLFQRVDSTVHLPSRRSLITLMIQRSEREVKNGLTTSQSTLGLNRPRQYQQHQLQQRQQQQQFQQQQLLQTQQQQQQPPAAASPNDSDDAALMMRHRPRGPQSTLRPINEIPRSAAQPIVTSAHGGANYAPALSPRTNRRNMLSTELTESLRRHLLWERSQKTSTANAVLKRRHTSQDVANLRQYPEPVHMGRDDSNQDANANSFDQYLNRDAFNGYHAKGW
ncbi:hypothetical protein SCUCBS95973_008444 [Sporothrix curviconia]|uniref:Nitrogen regulatory protein areA GATA-like domain-containing protein n=1 Tax=Sporothrix curviconia TaxID=1260050 RepID=A0ABP0CLM2_9PEZI